MKNSDLIFFAALAALVYWFKQKDAPGQVTESDINSAYTTELERRNSTPWTKDPEE